MPAGPHHFCRNQQQARLDLGNEYRRRWQHWLVAETDAGAGGTLELLTSRPGFPSPGDAPFPGRTRKEADGEISGKPRLRSFADAKLTKDGVEDSLYVHAADDFAESPECII